MGGLSYSLHEHQLRYFGHWTVHTCNHARYIYSDGAHRVYRCYLIHRQWLSVSSKFIAQLVWTVLIFAVLWQEAEMQTRLREFMVPFFSILYSLGINWGHYLIFVLLVGVAAN